MIRAIARGDLAATAPLLNENLRVMGALIDVDSRADRLEALRADPPAPSG